MRSGATASPVPDGRAPRFLLTSSAWMLALFALLRAPWVQSRLLTPLAGVQEAFARHGLSGPARVSVTLDCAGADLMALCAGVLLAFPAAWTHRLIAAALGMVWVVLLNSLRIAVLERVAGSPSFDSLHLYLLPVLLQLGAAAYVFGWIWWWTRAVQTGAPGPAFLRSRMSQFGFAAVVLLTAYALLTPSLADSALVAALTSGLAASAAFCLNLLGATAQASGALLDTQRGRFLVTAECVLSPLMPLALAAAVTWPTTLRRRGLLVLASVPLFMGLNLGRLLVLAVPAWLLGSPLFVTHGFRQGVLGLACITAAGVWRSGTAPADASSSRMRSLGRVLPAILAALGAAVVAGPLLSRVLLLLASAVRPLAPHVLTTLSVRGDEQGALATLPVYQIGLLVGLLVARRTSSRSSAWTIVALIASQLILLIAMGELAARTGLEVPAVAVRALAVGAPIALAALAGLWHARSYQRFWHDVGEQFPDLGGAASTEFYRSNEIRLFREHLGDLAGRRVFKTDLWDEARNTRILQWARAQGASAFGADISAPTLIRARDGFDKGGLQAAVGDVRWLPFADASFDVVYSMGTIEHFADSRGAAAEIFRVLKPGHRAIVGVPNRHDPFLRPLLVSLLSAVGLYDYGFEKSFTRRQIRALLESVGFEVVSEPAILFIPGWLRMLDLWCHTRCPPLARVPAFFVSLFVWLDLRVPAVRRFGYLLATVVKRPEASRMDSPVL